jgi:hypothetical protein
VADLSRFADWIELCVVVEEDGIISFAKFADIVRDAGLIGTSKNDIPIGDESFSDADNLSEEEAGERFAERVWEHLENRSRMLQDGYPLEIHGDRVIRRTASWTDSLCFVFLLIADLSRFYPDAKISTEPRSKFPLLFEKVVEACGRSLLKGASVRFGVPVEHGWPKNIKKRIDILGDRLALLVESLEGGKVKPKDQDRGLDVAARLSFGDDGPGTVVVLTQCATGKHWKKKRGEPSITAWQDILQWNAKLVRAVAVPWRLEGPSEFRENFRHFDGAVIFDRLRLARDNPDRSLNDDAKDSIASWCEAQIKKLPTL